MTRWGAGGTTAACSDGGTGWWQVRRSLPARRTHITEQLEGLGPAQGLHVLRDPLSCSCTPSSADPLLLTPFCCSCTPGKSWGRGRVAGER